MKYVRLKVTNPVRMPVMKVLKQMAGGNKVTEVEESEVGFKGKVFKSLGNHQFELMGVYEVTKQQLLEMGVLPLPTSAEATTSEETTVSDSTAETTVSDAVSESEATSESLFG